MDIESIFKNNRAYKNTSRNSIYYLSDDDNCRTVTNDDEIMKILSQTKRRSRNILKELPKQQQIDILLDRKKQKDEHALKYREQNKELIQKRQQEYRLNHQDEIRERQKIYTEKNKQKIQTRSNEMIKCECGQELKRGAFNSHLICKTHLLYLANIIKNEKKIVIRSSK